jgi:nucleotide-binding universal stress UspA family protein
LFHSILVATDGSAHADRAVRLAAEVAGVQGAALTVMTVASVPLLLRSCTAEELESASPEQARRARRLLDDATVLVPMSLPATALVTCGLSAVEAILAEVQAGGHDLVVLGTRGHGAMRSALLGSVSLGVAERSPVPVLVARSPEAGADGHAIRRILVAVDGSSMHTAVVLEHAVDMALTAGAALTLLTVCPVPRGSRRAIPRLMDDEAADAEELLEDARTFVPDGVAVDSVVDWGSPVDCILEGVEERPCDLVVLGSRGRSPVSSALLGSVSRAVLPRSRMPVLVVRPRRRF